MNYDDILALVRAGYSKAEIDAMGSGAAAPAPVQPVQTAPQKAASARITQPQQPAPAQPAPAQPVPVAVAEQMEGPQEYNGIEQLLQQLFGSVNTLTQAVQAQNRATITGATPAQTTEEIARNATARMMGVTEKE